MNVVLKFKFQSLQYCTWNCFKTFEKLVQFYINSEIEEASESSKGSNILEVTFSIWSTL